MNSRVPVFLRGVALHAPGVKATRAFYETAWGLQTVSETGEALFFRGTGPEHWIFALREAADYGIEYIHFGVPSLDELEELHGSLCASGSRISPEITELDTPGGGKGFELIDPEGRRLRVSSGVEPHAQGQDVTGRPRKVTHVVLNTVQMGTIEAFYEKTLGLQVSDYSGDVMSFLRCQTEHHSIAFNRSQFASLNHVAFLMPSIDSYMRGIGRMKTAGHPIAWGPGRHGPGNNTFAYFVSPSGFVIEFTSEVDTIDPSTHQPKVWPRDKPDQSDQWLTSGPPTALMRVAMQGKPDAGWSSTEI